MNTMLSCELISDQFWRTVVSDVISVLLGQVLSCNLYTALNIPHDPVALEEHFQDDDDGPVSRQGYMPYLNEYILAKVLFLSPTSTTVSLIPRV